MIHWFTLYVLYFLKDLSSYGIVVLFISFDLTNWAAVLLYHQLNVNKCICRFPFVFLSPSIFTLLWLSFDDVEIYVVPLRYLRIAPQFSARRYSESYFLERRSDLSQNDSSGCNKMLKEATSHASSIKISLLYSLGVLACPKHFSRRKSCLLWMWRSIWYKYFVAQKQCKIGFRFYFKLNILASTFCYKCLSYFFRIIHMNTVPAKNLIHH